VNYGAFQNPPWSGIEADQETGERGEGAVNVDPALVSDAEVALAARLATIHGIRSTTSPPILPGWTPVYAGMAPVVPVGIDRAEIGRVGRQVQQAR
jgi:hypothetical protein